MHASLDAQVEAQARITRATENRRRLNTCVIGHHFDTAPIDWRTKPPATLRCLICLGVLPFECATEYVRGYVHAGGDPEAVFEGFSAHVDCKPTPRRAERLRVADLAQELGSR